MGWWGMDDATAQSRNAFHKEFTEMMAQAVNEGLYITIVDCHI